MGRGWDEAPPIAATAAPKTRRHHRIRPVRPGLRGRPGAQRRQGHDLRSAARGRRGAEVRHPRVPPARHDHRCRNREPARSWAWRSASTPSSASSSPSRNCSTDMGYDAAFVGTGAGSPKFAGIPGEAFNGVFSANEFLTRVNLMRGHRQPHLRHAGGHGQARGGGGRGQYRHGFLPRRQAHGRRTGDGGLPPVAPRIARAHRGAGARHRRGHRVPVAHQSGGNPGQFGGVGHRHARARRWNWASPTPPAAAARCRWRAPNS